MYTIYAVDGKLNWDSKLPTFKIVMQLWTNLVVNSMILYSVQMKLCSISLIVQPLIGYLEG